jgi:hypothetical protein
MWCFIENHMERTQLLSSKTNRLFPRRLDHWRRKGLSFRAAAALANASCDTVEEVFRLGPDYLSRCSNLSPKTQRELAALGNWSRKRQSPIDAIAAALAMAIADPAGAREAAADAVIALRRSGYVLSARRTEGQA